MKPYTHQDLEERGLFSTLMNGKPSANAWAEINNILAEADTAQALTPEKLQAALKRWSAKLNEHTLEQRSNLYRKFADHLYSDAQSPEDDLFAQAQYLADLLQLPPHLVKLADKGAKTAAFYIRCTNLLNEEEPHTIKELNDIFGYDYEDSLHIRKQAFADYFNKIFDGISERQRYTPTEEELFLNKCKAIDIPFELKNNIENALNKYRNIWNAENREPRPIKVNFPLKPGEECYIYANCGLCEHKLTEREDNYFELTRKFSIDETVSFKGEKIEQPIIKEEATVMLELGYFFITNQRIIYLGQKYSQAVPLTEISGADFDGINIVTYHTKKGDLLFKYSDEAAETMQVTFNRILQANVSPK